MPVKGHEQIQSKMKRWYQLLMRDIPTIVANEATNFFRQSFHEQGWTDVTFEPWAQLSTKTKKKAGGRILIESGKLLRSIHATRISMASVVIEASMPYAKAHNEGFEGNVNISSHIRTSRRNIRVRSSSIRTQKESSRLASLKSRAEVRTHTRRMKIVKRQFMGNSHELNLRIKLAILKHGDKLWNSL